MQTTRTTNIFFFVLFLTLLSSGCENDPVSIETNINKCYANLLISLPDSFTGTACHICTENGDPINDSTSIDIDKTELTLISAFYSYDLNVTTENNNNYFSQWEIDGDGIATTTATNDKTITIEFNPNFKSVELKNTSSNDDLYPIICSESIKLVRVNQ